VGIFRAIFAFDRVMRRVPSIIEIWFFEFLCIMGLSLGIARLLDGLGVGGCPPAAGAIDGTAFGCIAFGLAMAVPAMWRLLRPRVEDVTWTPTFIARDVAPVPLPVKMRAATVHYQVLTSHPSYGLVHLLTLPVAVVALLGARSYGCATSFFKLFGLTALALIALIVAVRFAVWFAARGGRDRIAVPEGWTFARLEWELAWQPVVAMFLLFAGVAGVIVAIIWATGGV
jgi:hypothetical protein